jgi:hypothetical protein
MPKEQQDTPAVRAWRLLECGHVWPLLEPDPETCEQCELNELYLEDMIANALHNAAVRSIG